MNGQPALRMIGENPEFPFGELHGGTLIVCLNREHRKNVAESFQKVARYVIPGVDVRQDKWQTIILFTPQIANMPHTDFSQWQNWINNEVLISLHPNGGKAYYV